MFNSTTLGTEAPSHSSQEEALEKVAGGDLAPSCGEQVDCSPDRETLEMQLQFLMRKADDLQSHLVNREETSESNDSSGVVQCFLYSCQPYFTYLEATARSTECQQDHITSCFRSKLLAFSQQLSAKLEQLLLSYNRHKLLSLDETKPDNVSHFYIGQCEVDRLRVTMFRYCEPSPYLAGTDTGLYKRMRWNVDRFPEGEREREPAENEMESDDTEYYFLCYEDVPNVQPETDRDVKGAMPMVGAVNTLRTWSIGHWVQTHPDPATDHIYNWILCEVPQAKYYKLMSLGSEEPSTSSATDYLLGVLLSQLLAEPKATCLHPDCT